MLRKIATAVTLLLTVICLKAQIICNPGGNLFVYANYDGGVLNISVDVNVPNIKIGVCTYEPVTINITGPFAGNVTEVRYAGYVSTNHFHCSNSPSTTAITGVAPGITSVNFLPPSVLSNPNGYTSIVCGYTCSTTTNQGGCNTADQIKAYFEQSTGGTLSSYYTQYGCWSTAPYLLSAGGNCCSAPPCAIVANAGQDQSLCPGDSASLLGSATGGATTYVWSPSTGLSNPNSATTSATPSVTTTYILTASDGGSCSDQDTIVVTVLQPSASIGPIADQCSNSDTLVLTVGTPSGGTWSGPGVSNGNFVASQAGVGHHPITYTVLDSNGCTASATDTIVVLQAPAVSLSPIGPFCESDPPTVLSNGSPAGGIYSGPGVSNGSFFPATAGPGNATISYQWLDANGCWGNADLSFNVIPTPPTPTLSFLPPNLICSYQGDSVQWFEANGFTATGDSILPIIVNGSYTAIVWVDGCPSLESAPIQASINALSDFIPEGFQAWPNPFQNTLNIQLPEGRFDLALLDALGRKIWEKQAVQGQNRFDWSNFPAGIYFLQVNTEEASFAIKLQKQ